MVVEAIAERLLAMLPVLVAPTVGIGFYPAFVDYPGSQHVEADTFQALMIDLVEGYLRHGAERIVVLNNGVSTEAPLRLAAHTRSEEHTSELQSLMRISYAVFCLKKNNKNSSTTLYKHHTI